jgi:hypothetical protein
MYQHQPSAIDVTLQLPATAVLDVTLQLPATAVLDVTLHLPESSSISGFHRPSLGK